MATFKELTAANVKSSKTTLTQLIDVIQEDISGSSTRRKFQVFVTGGVGPGVTSSLWQTVYDQDFTLPTANAVLDMTIGLFASGTTAVTASTGTDTNGKLLFASNSLMMREKVAMYQQFAQALLGNATSQFVAPINSTVASNAIEAALFIAFKRLFARDQIKRETFAIKFYQSASDSLARNTANLNLTTESGSSIYTDVGSSVNKEITFGGQVSNVVDASNTSRTVGLMFNDRGILVLDLAKVLSGAQHCSGAIDAMNANNPASLGTGKMVIGNASGNVNAKFIPDFLVSASMDNIIDHIAAARFSSGTLSAIVFQNITNVNSTLFFCQADSDEFNYSSNPTYIDSNNRIIVIDQGQEDTQQSFTFVTSVGLHDANNNLLAVAKLSRPVEKNVEKSITFRVRLDF